MNSSQQSKCFKMEIDSSCPHAFFSTSCIFCDLKALKGRMNCIVMSS